MLSPKSLQKGDLVYLLSTARKVDMVEIEKAIATLKRWGLNVECGKSINASYNQFAGSDELRRNDLQTALNRHDVAAILCCRGGYGTVRILDDLQWHHFLNCPKWLCGFSDVTVLHTYINTYLGIKSCHSLMAFNFETATSDAIESLRKVLFGELLTYTEKPHHANVEGTARAKLVGGNLSILYSLSGTSTQLQTDNCILFIEDIDEYYYHIDRMMQNMKRSNKLKHIKGLIVGEFSDLKDNKIPYGKSLYDIIHSYVDDLGIPVCFDFPAGHIINNKALIFGNEVMLSVSNECVQLDFI